MYVCICNGITDTQICEAARSGVSSLWDLQKELGVSSNCGQCRTTAMQILRDEILNDSAAKAVGQPAASV